MTIDDRLTERHEALAQSIELMVTEGREQTERIRGLERLAQQDGCNIRALVALAERRPAHLEGEDS